MLIYASTYERHTHNTYTILMAPHATSLVGGITPLLMPPWLPPHGCHAIEMALPLTLLVIGYRPGAAYYWRWHTPLRYTYGRDTGKVD